MNEAWIMGIFYALSVAAVLASTGWGWQANRRADAAELDVDTAYREGFDDGQADRRIGEGIVLHQEWPPRESYHMEVERTQLELPDLHFVQASAGTGIPAPPDDDDDDQAADLEGPDGWLAELRAHPPFYPGAEPPTDERLERVVLPLVETDTGWMRRVEADQATEFGLSVARVDALAEVYYHKMGGNGHG